MKVLVTGSTGFIGSALCRSLCEKGDQITVFHRPSSVIKMIEDLPVKHVTGDLCDERSVESAFIEKPEIVFHLGAQMAAGRTRNHLMDVNVGGTRRVFQAAIRNGAARVILMSSAFTLGIPEISRMQYPGKNLISESHTWNYSADRWPYAWSKFLAEKEVQLASAHGLDVVILNPSIVIGPGDHYRRTNSFLVQMKKKPPVFLVDGGINLVHIQDVVNGLIQAVDFGERGERYILGGTNISFHELFRLMAEIAGFPAPKLALSNKLSREVFKFKNGQKNPTNIGSMETDLLQFAGYFFYYDTRKARLNLHLPQPQKIDDSLKESWAWFEGK
jgi:dihydroflavonol-4-reductase